MMKTGIACVALLFGALWAFPAQAADEVLPEGAKVAALEAFPDAVELAGPYAYRQLLLTAVLDSGQRLDVTRAAEIRSPDGLVEVSPTGLVRPKADGAGKLVATFATETVEIPLSVTGLGTPYEVSFVQDVMPAISKMGCNAGTCHGAKKGKNGFKLSLRGYDPLFDHRALIDDLAGRRYNRSAPDQSLMLLKASGSVPHTGGVLTRPGEPRYEMLRAWIRHGVKLDLDSPRVQSIEVRPTEAMLPLPDMKQQFAVLATYDDGRVRDVSAEAFLETSSTEVLSVDRGGLATALRRGEAAVLVRYEGRYAVAQVTIMGDRSGFQWHDEPANNYIDELVDAKLRKLKIEPAGLCTDAEFLRRVYLDLTGLPPAPEEVRKFLADERDTRVKRDEVIDRLIGSPEFVEYWTNKWSDLLQVNPKQTSGKVAGAMRAWIHKCVEQSKPYNQFVDEILTGSGSTAENPAAAYYQVLRTPEEVMENSTQLFLGVRFNCNKCHDHPFERWTQGQYYELAAFFAQVQRKQAPGAKEVKKGGNQPGDKRFEVEMVSDTGSGEEKYPTTGQVVPPKFPYEIADEAPADAPRRVQFAHWVTSPENQYFATSHVNRIWSYLLGAGFIEPVDDIRAGNPPTNPELLERLTTDFIADGWNTRELIRRICKSRTYQRAIRTSRWNEDDERNYSHALARRLPAETLYDTIYAAVGSGRRLPGGVRAVSLTDPGVSTPDSFLDLFGRPPRESACECERSSNISLGQTLNLVNGPTVAEAVNDPNSAVAKLAASDAPDEKVVEEVFLRVLCRLPTDEERAAGIEALGGGYDEDYAKLAAEVAAYETKLDADLAVWEKQYRGTVLWHEIEPTELAGDDGVTFTKQDGGIVLVGGKNPEKTKYTVTLDTDLAAITGLRLEVLPDGSLPAKGPGRAKNGNFVLNELTLTAAPKTDPAKAQPVKLQNATADFSQDSWAVAGAVDGNAQSGWAVSPQFGKPHMAVFETAGEVGRPEGTRLVLTLDHQFGGQHTIGRFRLSLTTSPRPLKLKEELPKNIAAILSKPADQRSEAEQGQLVGYYRGLDPEYKRLQQGFSAYTRWSNQKRVIGAQDLAWALINSPAFLFNR